MTQNAFLSSKVKSHFFFARQPVSLSISVLSKNVYTESILPSDRYWHNLKLWKGSLCWVFSEEELRAWCNFKIGLLNGRKGDDTVNKTQLKPAQYVLNTPGHFKPSASMGYGIIAGPGT